MSQVFFFKPNKGVPIWSNRNALAEFLNDNEGKEMYANMDRVRGVRSLDQNSFYWLYLEIIARETGHYADELHRIFKGLFLPKKKVVWKGKEYIMSGSTTKLSKTGMSEYMDRISAETEIPIPDPTLSKLVNYKL